MLQASLPLGRQRTRQHHAQRFIDSEFHAVSGEGRRRRVLRKPAGLGMRIVRALLDQMGVTLDVGSSHAGAEFRITVPLQEV